MRLTSFIAHASLPALLASGAWRARRPFAPCAGRAGGRPRALAPVGPPSSEAAAVGAGVRRKIDEKNCERCCCKLTAALLRSPLGPEVRDGREARRLVGPKSEGAKMMGRLSRVFPGAGKLLIAMAHVPALPGTPLYDSVGGLAAAIRQVHVDVDVLVDVGFDAVMFCNENDRPYQLNAGLEAAAYMARIVTECRPDAKPFGVDYLWDSRCGLAVAAATGAAFVRAVATGTWESDMGLWQTDAAGMLRERRRLGADETAILMNVTPEFASPVGARTPAQIAKSVVVSSLPDAILVSGAMAGAAPDLALVTEVRQGVPREVPVLLNTGAKTATIARYLSIVDGCIVGSELKVDGITWNPVDPDRAKRFVEQAKSVD